MPAEIVVAKVLSVETHALRVGEQVGNMRSSWLPFFLFAARSRHKKALPPLEKAVTGRDYVGLCGQSTQ